MGGEREEGMASQSLRASVYAAGPVGGMAGTLVWILSLISHTAFGDLSTPRPFRRPRVGNQYVCVCMCVCVCVPLRSRTPG